MFLRFGNLLPTAWFLLTVFNLSSMVINAAADDPSTMAIESVLKLEKKSNSTTTVLSWRLQRPSNDDHGSLFIQYRLVSPVDSDVPRLQYDRTIKSYRAWYGADDQDDKWKPVLRTEFVEPNELITYTPTMIPDFRYDFALHWNASSFKEVAMRTVKLTLAAPKSGAGCFRVLDSGFATRHVQFYWQGYGEKTGEYEIEIREEGPCLKPPVFKTSGPLASAPISVTLSKKRHWCYIRRKDHPEAGVSVVYVPHQENVFDGPEDLVVHYRWSRNTYSMTWKAPAGKNIANYTVFWIGTRKKDGRDTQAIMDIVYLPGNETSFKLTSKEAVTLGVAANTDEASSGLLLARIILADWKDANFRFY